MAEDYRTWEDFLDVGDANAPAEAGEVESHSLQLEDLLDDPSVPPELRELLAEKKRLEKQLMGLTGEDEEEDPDAERNRLRFPVKVHTKESRLQDRRIERRDEQRKMVEKRKQERRIAGIKKENERLELQLKERDLNRREALNREVQRRQIRERAVRRKMREQELEEFSQRRQDQRSQALQQLNLRRQRDEARKEELGEEARRQRILLSTRKGKPRWDEIDRVETDDEQWENRRDRMRRVDVDELRDRKRLGWD